MSKENQSNIEIKTAVNNYAKRHGISTTAAKNMLSAKLFPHIDKSKWPQYIYYLYSGLKNNFTPDDIRNICTIFKISPNEFLMWDERTKLDKVKVLVNEIINTIDE